MSHRALIAVRFDGGPNPAQVAAAMVAALEDFQEVDTADVSWVRDLSPVEGRSATERLAKVAARVRLYRVEGQHLRLVGDDE